MSELRRRAIRGLRAGDTFEISRTFSREDTVAFGTLTRDYNPVHYEPRFAQEKGFSGIVCHGLLTGSMICEVGGQIAWLATGMSFRFRRPVYPGDTIACRLIISEIDDRGRARAAADFTNQHGEQVATAELTGYLPTGSGRDILANMVAEGDPTNAI
jgi:3-hydroxybutyryl-CoA dehydratase